MTAAVGRPDNPKETIEMWYKHCRRLLLSGTAAVAFAGAAQAQQTPAGTVISNQAQASYTVNGTPQTTRSTTNTFVVDRKVNFTVERVQTAPTAVTPGQTAAVTTFRVTNLTNGTQDFILDPDQQNLSVGILPGTDDFDLSTLRAFVDRNNNGIYDPATDTQQFIDELAPDTAVTVFLVGTVPDDDDASLAFVSLHAIVAAGDTPGAQGTQLLPTDLNLLGQDDDVDIVFADGDSDGAAAGDIARNGEGRAYAAYEITARNVALTVTKSSRIVSDGVNAALPKALPGAVVEYCLVVRNGSLLTAASDVTLTDVVPENTTYVPGSIRVGGVGLGLGGAADCVLDGFAQDDDANDTGEAGPYRGSFDAAANQVTAVIPTLLGGTSLSASFRVTIN